MRLPLTRAIAGMLAALLALLFARPLLAAESSPADGLRAIAHHAEEGVEAAEKGNAGWLRTEWTEIDVTWERIEDQVREQNPGAYVEIEAALDKVESAVKAEPLDMAAAGQAFEALEHEATEVAGKLGGSAQATAAASATPADVRGALDEAYEAIERGDTAAALAGVEEAVGMWPSAEGAVAARSAAAYEAIEGDLGRALAALEATPAKAAEAEAAIERLRDTLAPFATATTYTAFDAAAVILREGLEALLVIVALLAFLRKSGNSDRRAWVWAGGGLGVLASVLAAFALQALFSSAAAGQNRELIEGITGLVAASLLFYVSYWLHSKASLAGWKRYIDERTTKALASGSMVGLAALAFLAVFREGAETAVFYLGMAPSISAGDLALGFGMGAVALVAAAVLMLVVGVRLPLRLFFRVAGLLVYYLGFKFVGTGIHALQVAGVLPTSPAGLPAVPFAGIYPTWETILPQAALLVIAAVVFFYLRAQDRVARPAAA